MQIVIEERLYITVKFSTVSCEAKPGQCHLHHTDTTLPRAEASPIPCRALQARLSLSRRRQQLVAQRTHAAQLYFADDIHHMSQPWSLVDQFHKRKTMSTGPDTTVFIDHIRIAAAFPISAKDCREQNTTSDPVAAMAP